MQRKPKRRKFSVDFDLKTYAKLDRLAKKQYRSKGSLVALAVDQFLSAQSSIQQT